MDNLTNISVYQELFRSLNQAWSDVRESGSMRICVIEGDSGMGKSRAVSQFIESDHIPAIVGRASQVPDTYLPLRFALESILLLTDVRAQLRIPRDEVSQQWRSMLATLASASSFLKLQLVELSDEWQALAQWRFFRLPAVGISESDLEESSRDAKPLTLPGVLTQALGELAGHFPLAFFIDDLDLCDSSTLDALQFIILPALTHKPILVIVAHESQPQVPDFHEFMRGIEERYVVERTALFSLSAYAVQQIVATEFPLMAPEQIDRLGKQVHKATGGSLAKVEDVLHWVKTFGEQAVLANPQAIPDHSQLMVQQFDELTNIEKDVLRVSSVQGRYFCVPPIASALKMTMAEVLEALERLEARSNSWIRQDSRVQVGAQIVQWYRFRGRQRHKKAYAFVSDSSLIPLHLTIGKVLESLYRGNEVNIAGMLATQFEKAGAKKEAAQYYALLANQADLQGDSTTAAKYAQKGLDNLPTQGDLRALRCRLMIEKGKALRRTDRVTLAIAELRDAYEIATEVGDGTLQRDAGLYLGELLIEGTRWDEGVEHLRRALELASLQSNWAIAASILESAREPLFKRGESETFINLCNTTIASAKQDQGPSTVLAIAEIWEDIAFIDIMCGRFREARTVLQEALASLEALQPTAYPSVVLCKLHRRLAETFERTDDFGRALEEAEQALQWARLSGQRKYQAFAHHTKAKILQSLGRVDDGENEFSNAITLLESTADLSTLAEIEEEFGLFLSQTGRKRRAREMYERSADHSGRANNFRQKQFAQNDLATLQKYVGEFEPALAIFRQLYNEALTQDRPDKSRQTLALNHMGDILRIHNHLSEAERCHRQAIELAKAMTNDSRQAFSTRYLGQALLAQWRNEDAETAIQSAVELQRKAHSTSMRYYSRVYLGRVMLNKGDIHRAQEILDEADRVWRQFQNLEWLGITNLSRGLALLCEGRASDALEASRLALDALEKTECWRVSEAYHLMARCYLALEEFERARECLDNARQHFMRLRLFHRLYQAESTEMNVNQARETRNCSPWYILSYDELRQDFSHLGI